MVDGIFPKWNAPRTTGNRGFVSAACADVSKSETWAPEITWTPDLSVCCVSMRMRSLYFLDWYQALPPDIKGEPIAVGVFIASSPLANFDVVDGMNLPNRGSYRSTSLAARARCVGCVEEKLPCDPVRMGLEPGGHGWVGGVFLGGGVEDFEVSNLVPRGRPIMRTNLC